MSVTRRVLATAAAAVLITVPASPALADKGGSQGNSNGKQTICHATSSNSNPYVVNTPNKNGDVDGHAGHTGPLWDPGLKAQHVSWGDVIPAFDYNDHGTAARFPGLNWDAAGQAWFANDCRVPITATVEKTNDANGDGTYGDDETASAVAAAVPFRVVVTNTSVVPAVVASLVDVADGGAVPLTCDAAVVGTTLPAGGSATCLATVAGYSPADGTSKVNTATVTLHEVGDTTNSGSASDTSTVRTFVPNPDVSVVKAGPESVAPGEELTWTVTVHNDGNVPLSGVTVSDSLPAGTTLVSATGEGWSCTGATELSCVLGPDLAVDATGVVSVTVTLAADFTGTSISNTAVVTPADATPEDNTSTVTTPVVQPPDVSVVKTGTATAAPGDQLTWTLTVHNDGNDAVSGVTVTDALPDGTTLVSASGTGWTCAGTTTVTCTLDAALAVDGTSAVTLVATLAADFTGTSVSNTAVVTPDDATPEDNTSTAVTTVTPGGGGGGTPDGFTGGGGGTTNPPATGGGGTVPFTGGPFLELLAGALALSVGGAVLLVAGRRGSRWQEA